MALGPIRRDHLAGALIPAAAAVGNGLYNFGQAAVRRAIEQAGGQVADYVVGNGRLRRVPPRQPAGDYPYTVEEVESDTASVRVEAEGAGGGGRGPPLRPRRRGVHQAARQPPGPGPAAVPPASRGRPRSIPPRLPIFEDTLLPNPKRYLPSMRPSNNYNVCRYRLRCPTALLRNEWAELSPNPPSFPLNFCHAAVDPASDDPYAPALPTIPAPLRGTGADERLGGSIQALFFRFALTIQAIWDEDVPTTTDTFQSRVGTAPPDDETSVYRPPATEEINLLLFITSDSSPTPYTIGNAHTYPMQFFQHEPPLPVYDEDRTSPTQWRRLFGGDPDKVGQWCPFITASCLLPVIPPCYQIVHSEVIRLSRPSSGAVGPTTPPSIAHVLHDLPLSATLSVEDHPTIPTRSGFCGPPLRMHLVPLVPSSVVPLEIVGCASLVFVP